LHTENIPNIKEENEKCLINNQEVERIEIISATPSQNKRLRYFWAFDESDNFFEFNFTGMMRYGSASTSEEDKIIKLKLRYEDDEEGTSLEEFFERRFTLSKRITINPPLNRYYICLGDDRKIKIVDIMENGEQIIVEEQNIDEEGRCRGPDLLAGTNDDCCGEGERCLQEEDGGFYCFLAEEEGCAQYKNEDDCINDVNHIVGLDPFYEELQCDRIVDDNIYTCRCNWKDGNNDGEDECVIERNTTKISPPNPPTTCLHPPCGPNLPFTPNIDSCLVSYEMGECANDERIVSVSASTCSGISEGDEFRVPCALKTSSLPFFNYINLIVALFFVGLIYIKINLKKFKNKNKLWR